MHQLEDIMISCCYLHFNISLLFSLSNQSIIIWCNYCCIFPLISVHSKCTVNYLSGFRVCVFLSNRRHYKTHILSSHRVQNNRNVFFSHVFFFSQTAAAFTIEFECHAFSARVVWLSTDRELCWIPFLSSCFNQCELAPLSYFMRGDFSASPLCRWFWLPLPSLVFKRWILVLTRELTLLPSLSPDCLPDCSTRLGILGHMLMRITLSEREEAGCIYRCFPNEAQRQEDYSGLETSLTLQTPTGMRVALYTATEAYMVFMCSNTPS